MSQPNTKAPEEADIHGAPASSGDKKGRADKIAATFEYAGDTVTLDLPASQRIEGAWHRVLAHFGISAADAGNLGLFQDGNEISRDQSFRDAGVPDRATLRIRPRVQRNGS